MFLSNRSVHNRVELRVVAFADDWIDGVHRHVLPCAALGHHRHQRVVHQPNVQRVGQRNRGFQRAQLIHLHKPRRFAKPVEYKTRGGQLFLRTYYPRTA